MPFCRHHVFTLFLLQLISREMAPVHPMETFSLRTALSVGEIITYCPSSSTSVRPEIPIGILFVVLNATLQHNKQGCGRTMVWFCRPGWGSGTNGDTGYPSSVVSGV